MSDRITTRSRFVGLRFKQAEYDTLMKQASNTTTPQLSEFIRRLLFNKEITFYYRNQSLDDFMSEMISLRRELNAIGNNVNQAVKKLHTLERIEEFSSWLMVYDSDRKSVLNKIEEIKNCINQIADEWLQ